MVNIKKNAEQIIEDTDWVWRKIFKENEPKHKNIDSRLKGIISMAEEIRKAV